MNKSTEKLKEEIIKKIGLEEWLLLNSAQKLKMENAIEQGILLGLEESRKEMIDDFEDFNEAIIIGNYIARKEERLKLQKRFYEHLDWIKKRHLSTFQKKSNIIAVKKH